MKLPQNFLDKMEKLLGNEFTEYLDSFSKPSHAGLRVNTMKIKPEEFEKLSSFSLSQIPWTEKGYYYNVKEQPAKHPYYYAGLYYIQEPSAMIPASLLPIEKGDKVLDLCAAPGGKSTELAAKLNGSGVLISNDISNSRIKALIKNLELFGVKNTIVLNETPEKLAKKMEGYFDKILIDAPCSGEGMFRKDPAVMKYYEQNGVEYYHNIQKNIIRNAAKMLKPGGMLLYSTCTFSPEENEGTIQYLLQECPEFSVIPVKEQQAFSHGRPEWVNGPEELKNAVRIWPHKSEGEGHFAALLKKADDGSRFENAYKYKTVKLSDDTREFLSKLGIEIPMERLEFHEDRLYLLPEYVPELKGLHILRCGLFLGEEKKKRFEPSQALANALKAVEYGETIDFSIQDERVIKYLKGETITIEDETKKGWQLVCVDGFPLGWGKANGGILKNKYLAGWRWM